MNKNKVLWNQVCTTDPAAVKPITGKQYKGNSPKPYWIVERLTDVFGPCGIGWGFNIISERIERFSDTDSLHIAVVRLWYSYEGIRGELEQIGQTKASYNSKNSGFILDEDAPKKSVTDALVKCASYLGFAGDIFSGRWDDSQYVAEAGREWNAAKAEAQAATRAASNEAFAEFFAHAKAVFAGNKAAMASFLQERKLTMADLQAASPTRLANLAKELPKQEEAVA